MIVENALGKRLVVGEDDHITVGQSSLDPNDIWIKLYHGGIDTKKGYCHAGVDLTQEQVKELIGLLEERIKT